jgi:cytochrome P450 family 33
MHEELDRVIGSERMITVTDKQDLPYCNAVIMESQRLANIITANLLHSTRRDININGRTVKKGSIMVPQISVMMIDPEVTFLFLYSKFFLEL